jgi:muconate cycloisomerase
MQIDRVNIYKIMLPFMNGFTHSRRNAFYSENIIVEISADKGGITGFGEGAPRPNITGQAEITIARATSFVNSGWFPWELNHVSQIREFVDRLPDRYDVNPAVCAIESALLDVLGKREGKYITAYFPNRFYTDTVRYGAPVTLGDKNTITELCNRIKKIGIKQLRVKMGKDVAANKEALGTVVSVFGHDCDLRLDPNGIWDKDLAFRHIPVIDAYNVQVVEEPMESDAAGFDAFAKKMLSMKVKLMACQSAPTLKEVANICREGHYRMVNVKLSRSGGYHRSLKIISFLRERGVSFQIGSHLGESGLLSAAGRGLCLLCRDAVYCDGSYDLYLLAENTTTIPVSFGPEGKAGPLKGAGLGVEVDDERIKRLGDDSTTVSIKRSEIKRAACDMN